MVFYLIGMAGDDKELTDRGRASFGFFWYTVEVMEPHGD